MTGSGSYPYTQDLSPVIMVFMKSLCCGTVWLHGWDISVFPKTMVSTLLSVIIFTNRSFPPFTCTGVRSVHKWHQGYIYSYRVQNLYHLFQKPMIRHYSSIIFTCHSFQPLSISLLRVIFSRSVLCSILLNYKKIILRSHWLAALI